MWICIAAVVAAVTLYPAGAFASPALTAGESLSLEAEATQVMYRLYNVCTGEHFYTVNTYERDGLVAAGWFYEGVGWVAPAISRTPVMRLYNPNASGGDHLYTTNTYERDALVQAGWSDEGVGWYSDDRARVPIYRSWSPAAASGSHNYTSNGNEYAALSQSGWIGENVGWYAVDAGWAEPFTPSALHLQLVLNSVGGSGGLATAYGAVSEASAAEIASCRNASRAIGVVAINARTGSCVASGADARQFGASTIKAAYVAAVCKYGAPGIGSWYVRMRDIITYSSNADYNALCARYGMGYLYRIAGEAGVALDMVGSSYANFSARQLAKLWVTIRSYLISDEQNVELFRSLFGLGGYFKEGWMYSQAWCGQLYNIAGIQGDCVYAVMTRSSRPNDAVWRLVDAACRAVS